MFSRRACTAIPAQRREFARLGALVVAGLLALTATAARAFPLEIVTTSLTDGTAGVAYSDAVVVSSGTSPYAWTLESGNLPSGITLDGSSGELSGNATLAGTSHFIVLVSDALGDTATRALSATIAPAAPSAITYSVAPSGVVAGVTMTPDVQVRVADEFGNGVPGQSVTLALVGTGVLTGGGPTATLGDGVATFAGLSIDLAGSKQLTASSGALTPVTSDAFAVSPAAASTLAFQVQPSAVLTGVAITPAVGVRAADAFGNPVAGVIVTLTLVGAGTLSGGAAQSTNGSGLATFPALSIDRAGSAQLSASAGVLGPVLSAAFTVSCPSLTVSPASLPGGSQGSAYNQTIIASGGSAPYTFAVTSGALPSGLSLTGSGALTGTPSAGGQFDFTVTGTDANLCTGARAYSIMVCAPISVLPASLPAAQQGATYSQSLAASGGVAPYAFAVTSGALPAGVALTGGGLLTGTPTLTGVSTFTVTATATGGCTGFRAYSLTVPPIPAAVTDLAVARLTSGNDADGTSRMQVSFTPSAFTASAEVYRAPFGGYPRYDDAGGLLPPTPLYPPGAPWQPTAVTASGQTDEPASRDAWSYVVFVKNAVGQVSAVSNKTAPKPNYALGDVSNGFVAGAGDNLVSDLDISLLGAHYGISGGAILSAGVSYLDVGPTTDLAVTSRPFTDGRIDFEDLIVFATNYGATSAPAALIAAANASARSASEREHVFVQAPSLVEVGTTFAAVVRMEAGGRMQGLSAALAWDASVAEPIAVASSGWVESQQGVVLSARPGTVDAALLGARSRGLLGAGELATVTFRALRVGDPAVRLARVLGRDAANRPIGDAAIQLDNLAAVPARTLLLAPTPNPSRTDAAVAFALAQPGNVDLAIYSVDGRRVQVLAHGAFAAGSYRFTWNGTDQQQRPVAPGVFYAQLVAGGRRFSHTLIHLR